MTAILTACIHLWCCLPAAFIVIKRWIVREFISPHTVKHQRCNRCENSCKNSSVNTQIYQHVLLTICPYLVLEIKNPLPMHCSFQLPSMTPLSYHLLWNSVHTGSHGQNLISITMVINIDQARTTIVELHSYRQATYQTNHHQILLISRSSYQFILT